MLLSALKLAIPRLQQIPPAPGSGGRPIHERAVEVTLALVDMGMDAECMSAGGAACSTSLASTSPPPSSSECTRTVDLPLLEVYLYR